MRQIFYFDRTNINCGPLSILSGATAYYCITNIPTVILLFDNFTRTEYISPHVDFIRFIKPSRIISC